MKSRRYTRHGHRGIAIGAIIAAIALAGFLAVAYASSNQSASSLTGQQSNKTNATTVITQGTNVITAWQAMMTKGYTMTDITFKGAPGYAATDATETDKQIFHPVAGATTAPVAQASTQDSPGTTDVWHYWTSNVSVSSAGGTALGTTTSDAVAILPKVKLGVCQQINNTLNGDAVSTTPLTGNVTLADLQQTTPGSAVTIYSVAGTATPRPEGCLATTDGTASYFYFKVMQIQ